MLVAIRRKLTFEVARSESVLTAQRSTPQLAAPDARPVAFDGPATRANRTQGRPRTSEAFDALATSAVRRAASAR
jgi:hypothetical protein